MSCDTNECPWTKNIPNAPEKPLIRCFAYDSIIKVVWMKPFTVLSADVKKYTIFIEDSNNNRDIKFNFPACDKDHCEQILYQLNNDTIYNIYMVATNSFGDSPVSNVVNIKPNKNVKFDNNNSNQSFENQIHTYDDSIKKLYNDLKTYNIDDLLKDIDYNDPKKDENDA